MTDLLCTLRTALLAAGSDDQGQPSHARAFAEWVQYQRLDQSSVLAGLAGAAAKVDGPARQTVHVAVLGYAANLDASFTTSFNASLSWLRERQYFATGRPLTFEVDGLGLLGVAVGINRLSGTERDGAVTWFADLLRRSLESRRPSDWNESLIAAALCILTGEAPTRVAADLQAALAAKALVTFDAIAREAAWELVSGLMGLDDGMTRAATQLSALTFLLRNAATLQPGSVTVTDVGNLLHAVPRSMRRWTWENAPRTPNSAIARWEVENEYHVQDMLWVILAPVFPDLDDEEWLKSLGHHKPRSDLAIASLELIIEVKFLRAGGPSVFSKVITEVAADAGTYLQDGSGYRHIIAFIWDDEARTEEHAELRQGLMRIPGVRDAVVLSRPSRMLRNAGGAAAAAAQKPLSRKRNVRQG